MAEHAGILSLAPIGWAQPGSRPSAHAAPDPVQVHGSGTLVTAKLKVTAPRLTVTADFYGSPQTGSAPPQPALLPEPIPLPSSFNPAPTLYTGGSLQIGLAPSSPHAAAGLLANQSVPLAANATDFAIDFAGGATFAPLVGEEVVLVVRACHARLNPHPSHTRTHTHTHTH